MGPKSGYQLDFFFSRLFLFILRMYCSAKINRQFLFQVSYWLAGFWCLDSDLDSGHPHDSGVHRPQNERWVCFCFFSEEKLKSQRHAATDVLFSFFSTEAQNPVARFILCCLKCCFWCLEKFIKFLNRNAYIMVSWASIVPLSEE